jgi:hypothetical protein
MILKLFMLASWAVLTMSAQELVQPNLDGFKYPALARSARIQGTVEFVVKSDGAQLVSGYPMLASAAKSNLEKWAVPYASDTPLSVTYIFRLKEFVSRIIEVEQPIGNGFDRFFLRLFRRPIARRIKEWDCVSSNESSVRFENAMKDGVQSIKIDIEAMEMCLETDTVALAELRD